MEAKEILVAKLMKTAGIKAFRARRAMSRFGDFGDNMSKALRKQPKIKHHKPIKNIGSTQASSQLGLQVINK